MHGRFICALFMAVTAMINSTKPQQPKSATTEVVCAKCGNKTWNLTAKS